jgi:hypothetical protein
VLQYTEMWGEGSDDEEGSCHEDDAALPAGNDRYSSGAAEGGGQYAAGLTQRVASADPAILSLMDEVVLSRLAAKLGIELEAVPPHTSQQGQVTAAGEYEKLACQVARFNMCVLTYTQHSCFAQQRNPGMHSTTLVSLFMPVLSHIRRAPGA